MRKLLAALAVAASAAIPANASSIAIDSVAQRWPWNNKVDITYTVEGGQNVAASVYARIVFTATIDGKEYTIDGVHDVGASASDGQHTVTWTLPTGLRATGCTMTTQLLSADDPSGDDYMVIDLDTGKISYEGLLASQDASNERYKDATYKTDKLVLRRVPRWAERAALPNADALPAAGYPTGYNGQNYTTKETKWATDRDYYIGVFPVTQGQYVKLGITNPADSHTDDNVDLADHRPVEKVSWNDLRGGDTKPTESIPAVASDGTGTFLQRLNHRTGLYFDLPTAVMFEIAERAGAMTHFFWGDTMDTSYVVYTDNSGDSTRAVGSRNPNAWGLYDTAGNVWEWCLDDTAEATNAFTPGWESGTDRRYCGGGSYSDGTSSGSWNPSYKNAKRSPTSREKFIGFRVACIAD